LGERPSEFKGLDPRQVSINDKGVEICSIGRDPRVYYILFEYRHGDIIFNFTARRPGKDWIDYDPDKKRSSANFALGPMCQVRIDKQLVPRPLSPDEEVAIKENITDFLLQEYPRFRSAVPPFPERIIFL
jgi:hypothetical protein